MVAGHRHDFRQSMKHTIVLLIALMPSPFRQDPAIKIPVWRTLKENRSEAPSSFKCRQVAASPEQLWRRYVTRNRMWVRYAMNIVFQFRQFFFDLFVAAGVEVPHTITCRRKIGSGAAAPLLLPILYVKRVFLFPGLALRRDFIFAARGRLPFAQVTNSSQALEHQRRAPETRSRALQSDRFANRRHLIIQGIRPRSEVACTFQSARLSTVSRGKIEDQSHSLLLKTARVVRE